MTETLPTECPLVTFALFTFNQQEYVRDAIEGAFSQTYEPLEIILSDNCSSDRTFENKRATVFLMNGQTQLGPRPAGRCFWPPVCSRWHL